MFIYISLYILWKPAIKTIIIIIIIIKQQTPRHINEGMTQQHFLRNKQWHLYWDNQRQSYFAAHDRRDFKYSMFIEYEYGFIVAILTILAW